MNNKPKITIIDNHPDNLLLMQELLSEEFEILSISDPREAIDFISEFHADLIISDNMMPELDGITLIKKIKIKFPSIPVILISSITSLESEYEAFQAGAATYLPKPVDFNVLINKIKSIINTKCQNDGVQLPE